MNKSQLKNRIVIGSANFTQKYGADSTKISSYESVVADANNKINTLNRRIYIIKKETDEKINNINNLNNDELYKFFTDRYRQYLDSIGSPNSEAGN